MNEIFGGLKSLIESSLGVRFYRNSLPHGCDAFHDLARRFELSAFQTVFDVGANEGQTIASFQRHFGHATIHAFEPVSAIADKIAAKVPLRSSTHLHRLALGDVAGKATINVRQNQTSSLLEQPNEAHDYKEEIEISTLDMFAQGANISHIDYLKIDAEGFDLNVLKGGRGMLASSQIDFVQVEVGFSEHWRLVPLSSFMNYLQPYGYELFGLYEQVLHWTGEPWLLCANAIFIRRDLWSKPESSPQTSSQT